jgi:hypothetical protein
MRRDKRVAFVSHMGCHLAIGELEPVFAASLGAGLWADAAHHADLEAGAGADV